MDKLVFTSCFLLIFFSSSGQELEIYGGLNHQSFYDATGTDSWRYHRDGGSIIGVSICEVPLGELDLRITASLNSYRGTVHWGYQAQGSGSNTEFNTKRYDIGVGVFPFNVLIIKHIHLNIGSELKILISDQTNGFTKSWSLPNFDPKTTIIGQEGRDIHHDLHLGVIGRIAYAIHFTDAWLVLPQYSCYLGLTPEFAGAGPKIKSLRQYFCLGVLHVLK